MGDGDLRTGGERPFPTPAIQPRQQTTTTGEATTAAPVGQPTTPSQAEGPAGVYQSSGELRSADWPPAGVTFPPDSAGALRQATEKMEKDLKSGASSQTLQEDAALIEALMAVQKAKDQMDEAILKAFDAAMESARKMMEQYKEWLQKVKIPEEEQKKQQIQQKQLEQEVQKRAAQTQDLP